MSQINISGRKKNINQLPFSHPCPQFRAKRLQKMTSIDTKESAMCLAMCHVRITKAAKMARDLQLLKASCELRSVFIYQTSSFASLLFSHQSTAQWTLDEFRSAVYRNGPLKNLKHLRERRVSERFFFNFRNRLQCMRAHNMPASRQR